MKDVVIALRNAGVGPREIARRLNVSPGRVSGYLFRAGLTSWDNVKKAAPKPPKVPRVRKERPPRGSDLRRRYTPEQRADVRRLYVETKLTLNAISEQTGVSRDAIGTYVSDLPRRRVFPIRRYDHAFKVATITAALIGEPHTKIMARLGGPNPHSFYDWMSRPGIREPAQAMADSINARYARTNGAAKAVRQLGIALEFCGAASVNKPLLMQMNSRAQDVLTRRFGGESLESIAKDWGITRERVRQIEARWRGAGFVMPGSKPLSDAAIQTIARPRVAPWGRVGRRAPANPFEYAHAIIDASEPAKRGEYRISDTERERRREWARTGLQAHRRVSA